MTQKATVIKLDWRESTVDRQTDSEPERVAALSSTNAPTERATRRRPGQGPPGGANIAQRVLVEHRDLLSANQLRRALGGQDCA